MDDEGIEANETANETGFLISNAQPLRVSHSPIARIFPNPSTPSRFASFRWLRERLSKISDQCQPVGVGIKPCCFTSPRLINDGSPSKVPDCEDPSGYPEFAELSSSRQLRNCALVNQKDDTFVFDKTISLLQPSSLGTEVSSIVVGAESKVGTGGGAAVSDSSWVRVAEGSSVRKGGLFMKFYSAYTTVSRYEESASRDKLS